MYAIPKFHKNPTKFRFITSSVNCINKDISVLLNLILNELSDRIELESEFSWIIKNNKKVLESLENCNANPGFPGNHMITTFDFSTLYTALPHDDLIRCLVALYNKYFTGDIRLTFKYKKITISKDDFVNILKFCIRNSYISFDNKIFRQIKGIPMGSNYSPNAANLYLHFYEEKFLKINPAAGRIRYKNSFRFIDDLL
ncbi:MAG: reverse transcriptase domain-containing protein [Cyanobacteria bacterium J06582_2]